MNLTEVVIKKYYKVFAATNFICSILFVLLIEKTPFPERLFGAVVLNLGYFMFYNILSKAPLYQYRRLSRNNNRNKNFILQVFIKLNPIIGYLFSIIVFIKLASGIFTGKPDQLLGICIPIGIFLGNKLSTIKIDEKIRNTTHNTGYTLFRF